MSDSTSLAPRLDEDRPATDPRALASGLAFGLDGQFRPLHQAAGGQAEHRHLDARLAIGRALAELALVEALEIVDQARKPRRIERGRGTHRGRHLVHLAAVAQVDRPVEAHRFGRKTLRGELLACAFDERREDRVDLPDIDVRRQRRGGRVFVADIGRHQPEGAVHRRRVGDHDALDRQFLAEGRGQHAARAAEGMQYEIARIEPALDRDGPDQVGDLRRRDPVNADRRLLDRDAQGIGDRLLEDPPRGVDVERHRAAQEMAGLHVADQEHHVGQRRLGAAKPVADRAGPRAGRAWPDRREPGLRIELDDAAAPRADRHDVDLRRDVVEAVHHRLARIVELAVLDHADLEGGAAHVGGDDLRVAHQVAEEFRADDARRRAAFDHADRPVARFRCRQEATIALHHHGLPAIAVLGQQPLERAQIVARDAPGIGVDDGRRGPLVFARNRRDVARQGDIDVGRDALDQVADSALVLRIEERPQEGDGDRLDLHRLDQMAHGPLGLGQVELLDHLAVAVDALANAPDRAGRHQGRGAIGAHGVLDAILGQPGPAAIGAARDQQRVLEAVRREQAGRCAVARQDGVVHHG